MAIETRIFENKTVFGDWKVEKFIGSGSGEGLRYFGLCVNMTAGRKLLH